MGALGALNNVALYRRMFVALPPSHRAFLYVVLLQCVYLACQRGVVLSESISDDSRAEDRRVEVRPAPATPTTPPRTLGQRMTCRASCLRTPTRAAR
jgi:hypothetical protein